MRRKKMLGPRARMLMVVPALATCAAACAGGSEGEVAPIAHDPRADGGSLPPLAGGSECGARAIFDPETGGCAAARDVRAAMTRRAPGVPPSLRDQRLAAAAPSGAPAPLVQVGPSHEPGGLGAGVLYETGHLLVSASATLDTEMVVYPNGIGNLPDWLYTTATNRTATGTEVVGAYLAAGAGAVGIFDWSCSPEDPCMAGETEPAWVVWQDLADASCYVASEREVGGRAFEVLRYRNTTSTLADGRLENVVAYHNECTHSWDIVYEHGYDGPIRTCGLSDFDCGWWGPIVENFFPLEGQPIPELGFFHTTLRIDQRQVLLQDRDTEWLPPPPSYATCVFKPNYSWTTTDLGCPQRR